MNKLKHLAIIMDGNGRWAKERKMKRTEGHKEGVNVVRDITKWCAKNNISFLSLYAFSTENWSRPKIEVDFLMKLLEKYLIKEASTYMDNNIKFRVIGDMNGFSNKLRDLILSLEEKTSKNTSLTQILALNYGSKDEIARAVLKTKIPDNITKNEVLNLIQANLDTANIPDVDLLIRTGGEKRLSNFLLLQSAYAELYFCDTLFPDFKSDELEKIIDDFKKRNRRFGNI
ncbi:di-trans,poly-cis-decaprenylcistransferase [Helicobacter sp. MIT 99-5507]|uniref:di-trans,poly-cis-decaprenylcistransferase n=1 Tax=Helicobacter sp. MIT 99-5507 TaxID=152489 RepID=UPI000E1EDE96|nr:di-trans,poly-cis-decaprenylcistransferase [Helicobacter sp. MIT 99-5507]RDU57869.1 di-trans,poly-cis-decaprenylcistransferase [Helicobacter sp. MIT 99-5507]